MGVRVGALIPAGYLGNERMHVDYLCPYHVCFSSMLIGNEFVLTKDSEGLRQRLWINLLAIYVGLGFIATELSLFLICRPLSNYWAVPTPNCMFF